jgi:Niemann-Pick C1 protein
MRIDCFPCVRLRPPVGLYERNAPAGEGVIAKFIRKYYAPTLLKKEVKQIVLAVFGGMFLTAIIGISHITLGLGMLRQRTLNCVHANGI